MRALVAMTSCSQKDMEMVMRPHVIFARLLQVRPVLLTGFFFFFLLVLCFFGGFVLVFLFVVIFLLLSFCWMHSNMCSSELPEYSRGCGLRDHIRCSRRKAVDPPLHQAVGGVRGAEQTPAQGSPVLHDRAVRAAALCVFRGCLGVPGRPV